MLGGVAIWLTVIITYARFIPQTVYGKFILLASTFLFLVGLVDDILHIKPYQKLIGQVIGRSVCRLLRIVAAVDRLRVAEHGARDLLVDRHHERHQPARQHGRARVRHRDHRRRVSGAELR